jgi:hypothetical protein
MNGREVPRKMEYSSFFQVQQASQSSENVLNDAEEQQEKNHTHHKSLQETCFVGKEFPSFGINSNYIMHP